MRYLIPSGFFDGYATEPIGDGNPYHRCIHCQRSVPEINGRLDRHLPDCKFRQAIEQGIKYNPYEDSDE